MSKEELLEILHGLKDDPDREVAHSKANEALLCFIGDDEVRAAFEDIPMWYA